MKPDLPKVKVSKTTAAVPPSAASEFAKARAPQAVSEADGHGYTKTKPMFAAKNVQFGLPKSAQSAKSKVFDKDRDRDSKGRDQDKDRM